MTLTEILRMHNPDIHPDCHAAADEIESLQSRLDEANKWSDVDHREFTLMKERAKKAEASNKVLREALDKPCIHCGKPVYEPAILAQDLTHKEDKEPKATSSPYDLNGAKEYPGE